jgi:putative ABC transport system substrate-binding protein
LELLKEIMPQLSRVAVLYQPYEEDELREIKMAAQPLRIQIQPFEVTDTTQFQNAYATMKKGHANALIISRSTLTSSHRKQLIDLAIKSRLPPMCETRSWTNDGCLMSYAATATEGFQRAATYVDKILKGAKPADLPVEQPTKFELVINLKTAKQIGLTIPPNVLARADRVIR